nr:unnamed protein product [Spirometra erinaceieuropaei]
MESPRSPARQEAQDVQSSPPAEAASWGRDLNGVQEAGAEAQPLPPQLSPADTEAETTGPDLGHRLTGADKNPRHPRHAEMTATALKRPSCEDGRRVTTQTTLL